MASRWYFTLLLLPCLMVQESVSQDVQCFCLSPEFSPAFASGASAVEPSLGSTLGDCAELYDVYQEDCAGCDCGDIDFGVGQLDQNDITLKLLPGLHELSTVHFIESVDNISIIGLGAKEDIVIECADMVGLAFINVSNLTIENVTVSNCGWRNESLTEISERAKEFVAFNDTYAILHNVERAVMVVHSTHVVFRNMAVKDTVGVGLTALNVLGDSTLDSVHFTNNSGIEDSDAYSDEELYYTGIGGSAIFFYGDLTSVDAVIDNRLLIKNCLFENSRSDSNVNSYVLVDSFFEIDDFRRISIPDVHSGSVYPLDGAAGISLIFSHHQEHRTSVIIDDTKFRNINHSDGGCMSVFFEHASANTTVLLDGISFDDCRGGNIGGGLLVGYGYPSTSEDYVNSSIEQEVIVRNTNFTNCRAYWGGGLAVISIPTFFPSSMHYQRSISLENCTWTDNRGSLGAAASFWEAKYHGVQRRLGMNIRMTDCSFLDSRIEFAGDPQFNSAVINFDAVSAVFNGSTYFNRNKLSCIGATRSELIIYGHFLAENTQVSFGGVLDFRDTSFFIVKKNANVTFSNNKALWRGGAISVNTFSPWPLYVYGACFLHFERFRACPDGYCYDPHDDGPYSMNFMGNKARVLGNDMFGATFRYCPWVKPSLEGQEILTFLETNFSDIMHFSTSNLFGQNAINFYMTYANITEDTTSPDEVMPGQLWNLDVTIYDYFNQSVPSVNTLYLPEDNGEVNITRGFSVDDNVVSYVESQENLRMIFNGTENDQVDFQFLAISRFQPVGNFSIRLSKCKAGFVYKSSIESCVCDPDLEDLHESIHCNRNGTISREITRWIGIRKHNNIPHYATSLCQFDYCDESVTVLYNLSDGSEQCRHNRTGMLCGECKANYSRVLGSTACLKCENYWLFYIALYLLSGVLIVFVIFALQISVSSGYLNGPILYANILSALNFRVFPINIFRYQDVVFVIFLFLNLEIGYESCFYDGMNQLAYSGIKLLYPFYLLLIVSMIVLMAKACPRLLRLEALQPVRAIATIMFLSFTNLFQTVIDILGIAVLRYEHNGEVTADVRWLLDASVDYGHGWHGLLVAVSVLILVFVLLPQVIVNIFYRPLRRVRCTAKLLQKWWPLFDAWHNPFEGNFRFWFGVQLLLRVVIAVTIQITDSSPTSFSLFVITIELIAYTILQAFARPYKGWMKNIIDLIFLFDLIILATSSLYYQLLRLVIQQDTDFVQTMHYGTIEFCLVFALLLSLLIFIGFVLNRIGFLRYFVSKILPKAPQRLRNVLMTVFQDAKDIILKVLWTTLEE